MHPPEPQHIKLADKNQHLITDAFLFSELRINTPELAIQDLAPQRPDIIAEIHDYDQLTDLTALGDEAARTKAQTQVHDQIARFGANTEPS